jgi:hypothetical protein
MTAKYITAYTGVTVAAAPPVTQGSLGLGVGIADRGARSTGNFKKPKTRPNGFKQTVVTEIYSSR